MYKTLNWILAALISLLLVVGILVLWHIKNLPAPGTDTNTTQPPTGTATNIPPVTSGTQPTAAFAVTSQDGSSIGVKDFLHNGETVSDVVNPGNYYLAGSIGYCLGNGTCPQGYKTNDFTVTYNTATEQFSVALLTQPLSTARQEVEDFLMDRLGLHRITLCNLRYYVSVPSVVDSKYAGMNLGFHVCPGAVLFAQ